MAVLWRHQGHHEDSGRHRYLRRQLLCWADSLPHSPAPSSRSTGLKEGIPAWRPLSGAQPAQTQLLPGRWDTGLLMFRLWNPSAFSSSWDPAVPQALSFLHFLHLNRRKYRGRVCFKQRADREYLFWQQTRKRNHCKIMQRSFCSFIKGSFGSLGQILELGLGEWCDPQCHHSALQSNQCKEMMNWVTPWEWSPGRYLGSWIETREVLTEGSTDSSACYHHLRSPTNYQAWPSHLHRELLIFLQLLLLFKAAFRVYFNQTSLCKMSDDILSTPPPKTALAVRSDLPVGVSARPQWMSCWVFTDE